MTVESIYVPVSYHGNGVTVAFAFPYQFFAPSDLIVRLLDLSTNTPVAPPALNGAAAFDYAVTGTIDDEGTGEYLNGTVIFNTPPPTNYRITIERSVAALQSVSLSDDSLFPAKSVEAELDRLQMQIQQGSANAVRAITAPASDGPVDLVLAPAGLRADTILTFDGAGNVEKPGMAVGPIEAAIAAFLAGVAPAAVTGAWAASLAAAKVLYAAPVVLAAGQTIYVGCRSLPYDGYGGTFRYDPGDTTDYTGAFLDGPGFTDAVGRRWRRIVPGENVHIHWFGARPDWFQAASVWTDTTPPFNAAIAWLNHLNPDTSTPYNGAIVFGLGDYGFNSRPARMAGNSLIGSVPTRTQLVKTYAAATPTESFIGCAEGGIGGMISNLGFVNAGPGGTAWGYIGTTKSYAGNLHIRSVRIGSDGVHLWDHGIYIDGSSANTLGGPYGFRSLYAHILEIFDCSVSIATFKCCNNLQWITGAGFDTHGGSGAINIISVADVPCAEHIYALQYAPVFNITAGGMATYDMDIIVPHIVAVNFINAGGPFKQIHVSGHADSVTAAGSVPSFTNCTVRSGGQFRCYFPGISYMDELPTILWPFGVGMDSKLATFTASGRGCTFQLWYSAGQCGRFFADFAGPVQVDAGSNAIFVASSTPGASQIGVYKAAGSDQIAVKAGPSGIAGSGSTIGLRVLSGQLIQADTSPH